MPKFLVVPALQTYPKPEGMDEKNEFESADAATAAATESMKITPTIERTVVQVISRISANVQVSVGVEK